MKIGLDMDDTICSTDKVIRKYVDKYCKYKKIEPEKIWISQNLKQDFLTKNLKKIYMSAPLKKNTKNVINKLKKLGNEIIIVTARSDKYIDTSMEELIKNYLSANEIVVDKIIINSKDKVDTCKKYDIDIMLEDNLYNYNLLINAGINAVLYDEINQHKNVSNRIADWKEFISFFENDR